MGFFNIKISYLNIYCAYHLCVYILQLRLYSLDMNTKVIPMIETTISNNYLNLTYIIMRYRIRSLFGGDFNLAVWQFFVCLPNLNSTNIVL